MESSPEALQESQGKKILVAKKFLLERRVLAKVLDNLGYEYDLAEELNRLESMLSSGAYDIVFADEGLANGDISISVENIAIITGSKSKEEIENIIKKYRG